MAMRRTSSCQAAKIIGIYNWYILPMVDKVDCSRLEIFKSLVEVSQLNLIIVSGQAFPGTHDSDEQAENAIQIGGFVDHWHSQSAWWAGPLWLSQMYGLVGPCPYVAWSQRRFVKGFREKEEVRTKVRVCKRSEKRWKETHSLKDKRRASNE